MKLVRKLLLCLSIIFVIRVYAGSFDSLITDLVRTKITEHNIPCKFESLGIVPALAVQIVGLSCSIPNSKGSGQLNEVAFQDVEISPAWRELLTITPGIKLSAVPVNGNPGAVSLVLSRSIRSGKSQAALDLNKFPVGTFLKSGTIPGLSIEGELNGQLALSFSDREDLVGQGNILFEKGILSASGMENSIVKLPALQQLSIRLPVHSTAKVLTFSPITAASSFGVLKGDATVKGLPMQPTYTFNGNLLLNELGMKGVGGFIALMAGSDVSKPVEEWKISVSGDFGSQPVVKITPNSLER